MNESRESSDARGVFGSHPNTNLPNTTSARVQSDYRSKPASQRYGKAEGSRMLTLKYALGSLLGTSDCVKFSTPAYDELIKRLSDDTIRDEAKAPASATILNANQGRPIAHQLTRERTPNKAHLTNDRLAINEKSNNADGAILNILVMTLGAGKGKADITNRANIPWNYKVWTGKLPFQVRRPLLICFIQPWQIHPEECRLRAEYFCPEAINFIPIFSFRGCARSAPVGYCSRVCTAFLATLM